MPKFLIFVCLVVLFSCKKQNKESNKNLTDQIAIPEVLTAIPIQKNISIPIDTAYAHRLSNKEITRIFTTNQKNKLGISNTLYQAYRYEDPSGKYYLVLTDHRKQITEQNDTLYDNVYALSLINKNNQLKKRSTILGEIDQDWETSIGFWNQYSELADHDKDGQIDPILVYGTRGQSMYEDGRVRIIAYYKKKKVTLKHQNSEVPDGRITKINKNFYKFPIQIQEAVKEKMRHMSKNGHAIFAEGWEEAMKNKATRLEKM